MKWINNCLFAATHFIFRPIAASPQLNYSGPEDDDTAAMVDDLLQKGHHTAADDRATKALDQARQEQVSHNPKVATALMSLAAVQVRTGSYESAKKNLQEALSIRVQCFGVDDPATMRTQVKFGEWHERYGTKKQADVYYSGVHTALLRLLGPENPQLASILNRLASLCLSEKHYDAAEVHARHANSLSRNSGGDPKESVAALTLLGKALDGMQAVKESLEAYRQAEKECGDVFGKESLESANCCSNLATFLIGNFCHPKAISEATHLAKRAFAVTLNRLGDKNLEYAKASALLGRAHYARGKYDLGDKCLESGIRVLSAALGEVHPEVVTLRGLSKMLSKQRLGFEREPDRRGSISLLIEQLKLGPAWLENLLSEFKPGMLEQRPTPKSPSAREFFNEAVRLQDAVIASLDGVVEQAPQGKAASGASPAPPGDDLAVYVREQRRQRTLLVEHLHKKTVSQWFATATHGLSTFIMLRKLALAEMQIAYQIELRLLDK